MRLWVILLGMVLLVWGAGACGTGSCSGSGEGKTAALQTPEEQEEQLMQAQERAEEIAQLKKKATVPATLGLIGFDIERDGIYFLQLVFDPKGTPLPAFEQELRNNLGGEIEIVVNGDPFKTIRYEDFVGFAPAPVGEGYGPVYTFQVDFSLSPGFGSAQFNFYPRIRANKPCSYTFCLSRKAESFSEKMQRRFSGAKDTAKAPGPAKKRDDLNHEAEAVQVNYYVEIEGNYGCILGIDRTTFTGIDKNDDEGLKIWREYSKFIDRGCVGTIKIFAGNNIIQTIDYNNSWSSAKYKERVGDAIQGSKYGKYEGFSGYSFWFDKEPNEGWYGFRPEIFSTRKLVIGIDIHRSYMRK